jgi:DNA-3-methyladenine glycosylase II
MYSIIVLDRPNVLPFGDGAFLQAYKWLYATDDLKPAAIKERCAPWSPYSSIAARYMYRALDNGLTRDDRLRARLAEVECK